MFNVLQENMLDSLHHPCSWDVSLEGIYTCQLSMCVDVVCIVVINPRRTCAVRVTVVVVYVCLSVTRHLTSRAINPSTNNTTYSGSSIGRNVCRVFSETAAFESYGV